VLVAVAPLVAINHRLLVVGVVTVLLLDTFQSAAEEGLATKTVGQRQMPLALLLVVGRT
jgi:hypothetical protein